MPHSVVNVPGDYFSMAGFEVTTYGRFWVTPEVIEPKKRTGKIYEPTFASRTVCLEGERSLTILSLCASVFTYSLGKVRNKSATDERPFCKFFIDATYRRVLCC